MLSSLSHCKEIYLPPRQPDSSNKLCLLIAMDFPSQGQPKVLQSPHPTPSLGQAEPRDLALPSPRQLIANV